MKRSFPSNYRPTACLIAKGEALGFDLRDTLAEARICAAYYRQRGERFTDLGVVFEAWLVRERQRRDVNNDSGGYAA
ncbi:hypothetical protein KUV64_11805 [Mameliella alba]|uniref:hypothetical protein n=1 Tax=Mameliella alba TaxID=561184 RepID=UPI001C94BCD7|nr:hypothetical protein [Mameliella alba]MBY6119814.1 hypothetical protein [Mameliella alba]